MSKEKLRTYADPELRQSLAPYEVGQEEVDYGGKEFAWVVDYAMEFCKVSEDLREKRAPWVSVAPADDPIHCDEGAI